MQQKRKDEKCRPAEKRCGRKGRGSRLDRERKKDREGEGETEGERERLNVCIREAGQECTGMGRDRKVGLQLKLMGLAEERRRRNRRRRRRRVWREKKKKFLSDEEDLSLGSHVSFSQHFVCIKGDILMKRVYGPFAAKRINQSDPVPMFYSADWAVCFL